MMLKRSELREVLVNCGFRHIPQRGKKDKPLKDDKAHRYEYPGLAHPLYLLVGAENTSGQFLVAHPQLQLVLDAEQTAHKALVGGPTKSTGLKAFPHKTDDPEGNSNWGIALGFQSSDDMRGFLKWLTSRASSCQSTGLPKPSATQYAQVLQNIEPLLSSRQRQMLTGHAMASDQTLSMEEIATLAGYDTYSSANLHYGKLGGLLGQELGLTGQDFNVYAIADFESPSAHPQTGHTRARMHAALHEALVMLGWIPGNPAWQVASAEVAQDPAASSLTVTERQQLTAARIGQGQFRASLINVWGGRCAVTGCNLLPVLVASHIKPWAQSTNVERLDPYNGLLLSSNADRLFDQGFISFTVSGQMLVKPVVTDEQLASLGLSCHLELSQVAPQHLPYLQAHRAIHGF